MVSGVLEKKFMFVMFVNLKELNCGSNQITQLDNLPQSLRELYCGNNQITKLDNLPPNLQILYCSNNELPKILNINTWDLTQEQKNIIYRFNKCKYRIMCLKYKQHFRKWLWERVRLPRINREYHPDKLRDAAELLGDDEETDLFEHVGWK
jgi:Leucine-rich repeat (LRR) protein